MKTIKFKVSVDTGFVGASYHDELEIEIEDNATPSEIENAVSEEAKSWMFERIELGYQILDA